MKDAVTPKEGNWLFKWKTSRKSVTKNSLKRWVKKPTCYKVETNPAAKKREGVKGSHRSVGFISLIDFLLLSTAINFGSDGLHQAYFS